MNDDKHKWDQVADEYDNFIGTQGDPIRINIVDPIMLELLGNLKNLNILDAGCGNGYFTNILTEKNAHSIGIDFSKNLIDIATSRFKKSKFQVAELGSPLPFKENQFDKIVAHFVMMDVSDIANTFKEFSRILKPNGVFVFSILHPCFSPPVSFWKRKILGRLNKRFCKMYSSRYFDAGDFDTNIKNSNCDKTKIHHRTISEYARNLKNNGFLIEDLREPKAEEDFIKTNPQYYQFSSFPVALIIKASFKN